MLLLALACSKPPEPAPIEASFAEPGPHLTTRTTRPLEDGTVAVLHAPRDTLAPVLIWNNGSSSDAVDYEGLLVHLASWGFVVIGANDGQMGTGERGWELVELARSEAEAGELSEVIDLERMGTLGTSQGSVGAINTYLRQDEEGTIDTVLANALPADTWVSDEDAYDPSDIQVPLFIVGGTQDGIIAPVRHSFEVLGKVAADAPSIAAHRIGAGHLQIAEDGGAYRGYVTAWMRDQLLDDPDAHEVFDLSSGELFTNEAWTDIQVQDPVAP